MDKHGNAIAVEGCTRCECGCKYWENDHCVDCDAAAASIMTLLSLRLRVLNV